MTNFTYSKTKEFQLKDAFGTQYQTQSMGARKQKAPYQQRTRQMMKAWRISATIKQTRA
jgi:hypothetical protein